MNGMIFQKTNKKKDSTPHTEHFILTFCLQECWHHLNSAGILPSASWARFIFFTAFFYVCSGETLKVHESTRTSCYFPKELVKPPTDTSSAKLHDDLQLVNKLTTRLIYFRHFCHVSLVFTSGKIRTFDFPHSDTIRTNAVNCTV